MKLSDFGTQAIARHEGEANGNEFAYKFTLNTLVRMLTDPESPVTFERLTYNAVLRAVRERPEVTDAHIVTALIIADLKTIMESLQ